MKILLVEDDEHTSALISNALTTHHYLVNTTENGQTALELTNVYDYDLVVLDVLIPGIDGFSLCRQLRIQGCEMPILMLTAQNSSGDRIRGLEAGADDYVIKPFDLSELVARVRALLRRRKDSLHTILSWENLQLNLDIHTVTYGGQLLHLTPKEYGLLELFMRNPRRIFNRGSLLDNVWNVDEFPGERAVTTQIKGLRQKLKKAGLSSDLIETVYGLGYRLKPEPINAQKDVDLEHKTRYNTESQEISSSPSESTVMTRTQAEAEVELAIAQVWEKFKEKLPSTFALFDQIGDYLTTGTVLDPDLKQEAILVAHRLVGTLGTFRLLEGSDLARQIEQMLHSQSLGPKDAVVLSERSEALRQVVSKNRKIETTKKLPVSAQEQIQSSVLQKSSHTSPLIRLLVVDDDITLTENIQIAACSSNFQINTVNTLADAQRTVSQKSFDAILLDLTFPGSGENGFTFLAEMSLQRPTLPVLVLTRRKRLTDRVEVARLGGRVFLQKPIGPQHLLEMVSQVLTRSQEIGKRILVVDDDPFILRTLASLLEPWGLKVRILDDPVQFWEAMEAFEPDLLILDVEMPHFNGLELCRAVRNDPYWGEMPILFLTAHQNTEMIRRIFMAGADDYVGKPVIEPEIVARVLNRLERVRSRRPERLNNIDLQTPPLQINAQISSML